jgi:hypothetical protein
MLRLKFLEAGPNLRKKMRGSTEYGCKTSVYLGRSSLKKIVWIIDVKFLSDVSAGVIFVSLQVKHTYGSYKMMAQHNWDWKQLALK